MQVEFCTNSTEETQALARRLGGLIKDPALILLKGPMGAGKTAFTKAFTQGYGSEDETSSPTFAIANTYLSDKGPINHLDLYRIGSLDEFYDSGLDSFLEGDAVTLIEWPEVAQLEDEADLIIEFSVLDEINNRKITIEGRGGLEKILAVLSKEDINGE